MNEIVKAEEFGVEETQAKHLTSGLTPTLSERQLLINSYTEVIKMEITKESVKIFRDLRLKILKNRTQGIDKWHKTNKAFFLAGGKFCDAIKNKESLVNTQMESKLLEAEKHFENIEKERIAKLQAERENEVKKYTDPNNIAEISDSLGDMPSNMWDIFISGMKAQYNERIAAEKKAEEQRQEEIRMDKLQATREKGLIHLWGFLPDYIQSKNLASLTELEYNEIVEKANQEKQAKEVEQEKIRLENERLKKEAEEKERKRIAEEKARKEAEEILNKAGKARQSMLFDIDVQLDFQTCRDMNVNTWKTYYEEQNNKYQAEQNRIHIENLKAERLRKELEEKQRIEREKQAELLRKQKEAAEKERKEKERIQKELQAKEAAENKRLADIEAAKQIELNKDDAAKVKDLISDLQELKTKYSFMSESNQKMYSSVGVLLSKVVEHIKK